MAKLHDRLNYIETETGLSNLIFGKKFLYLIFFLDTFEINI
jgi:hypothetical protein